MSFAGNVDLPRAPAVSPDGSKVSFTWRGDIWMAPISGGQAIRLTSHPGMELRSAWLPDGSAIVFESDREGGRNLYAVNADGSDVRQITRMEGGVMLSGVDTLADGTVAILVDASVENDLFRSGRPYWLPVNGGELRRVHDAFGASPAVSPDGTRVLFERGGSATNRRGYRGSDQRDIWMFDMRAEPEKAFTQLTTWEGNDWAPCWIGNDSFAYLSDRELNTQNVYRQAVAAGAAPQRLTDFDGADCAALSVGGGGRVAAVLNWDTIYSLALDTPGAKPVALKFTASEDMGDGAELKSLATATTEAALSPDGKTMAMVAFGDVWVRPLEGRGSARRVTATAAREKDIAWTADGYGLLFTTDEGGRESIMMATVTATRGDLAKNLTDAMTPPPPPPPPAPEPAPAPPAEPAAAAAPAPAAEPAPAAAPSPAPEPPASPAPAPAPAPPAAPNPTSGDALEQDPPPAQPAPAPAPAPAPLPAPAPEPPATPAAPAPAPASPAEPAPTPPAAPAAPSEPAKPEPPKPDPARWADAVRFQVEPFIGDAEQHVREANPSPDNTRIAYRRGRGDIMVMDIATRESTRLISGWDPAIDVRWSPDGKFVAYSQDDQDNNRDVWIIPSDGSAPAKNITRHPDNDGAPRWSADGKMMAFVSERNNNESDVFVVMLDKSLEGLQSAEREKHFKDAGEAARKRKVPALRDWNPPKPNEPEAEKPAVDAPAADAKPADAPASDAPAPDAKPADHKPAEAKSPWDPSWSLDDAYLRVRRVTSLLGPEGDLEMLPSGENVIFGASGPSGPGLYNSKWDGTGQRKISARISVRGLNFAGDQLVGVSGGKACLVPVNGTGGNNDGPGRTIDVDATIRVDLAKVYEQKFLEAMRLMGENFYHPTMKGLDWNEITQRYLDLARRARTASEFDSVANRALGELNASHMGIRSPGGGSPLAQSQGRLGVRTENVPEGLRVTFIMPESPAAIARNPLRVGDIITHVDEAPVAEGSTLDSMMTGTTGRETWLTVTRTFEEGRTASFDISFEPTSAGTIGSLAYNATRLRAAQLADEWSGGRIGYLHIQGMNQPSLDEFERDLFAAAHGKDGLIIDVRNNGGGWTADRLLASIMAPRHAYTVPRGADSSHTDGYPQDRLFIQRFSMPINMLCNEKSFSNAEIVAHAFKTLKRGTLVGTPTYGGVISTGSASLLDGTTVRMPTRGWYLLDGTDMENNGAVPDIIVPQTPEAEAAGRDEQLKAAVEDLMKRLPAKG